MDDIKEATARSTGRSNHTDERIDQASGRQFGYEMAFDPRFAGRRWDEVEPELRAIYQDWLKAHGYRGAGSEAWDEVKGAVREAWESALDVEHTQVNPLTGQWEEVGPAYRRLWEEQKPTGATWEDVDPGYHYAVDMRLDPRYQGRPWGDVAPSSRLVSQAGRRLMVTRWERGSPSGTVSGKVSGTRGSGRRTRRGRDAARSSD